jgi:hypothetical protein
LIEYIKDDGLSIKYLDGQTSILDVVSNWIDDNKIADLNSELINSGY